MSSKISIAGRRALSAVFVSLGACAFAGLGAPPALAQTVDDYEAALAAAMQAPDVDAACRPLVNYTFVSIPDADKADPSPIFGLLRLAGSWSDDVDANAKARAACLARLKQPVIVFDGGLGQDIVAQPPTEDMSKPLGERRPSY